MPPLVLPFAEHVPVVDDAAWLAPTATVIGRARVHARASVFYGAVIRADMAEVVLGRRQQPAGQRRGAHRLRLPHADRVGVSVGHAAVVHGCTVEDDCLIGMNATVLNGAPDRRRVAGRGGAVVLEGTRIPPRSLVAGVPGKVRRTLTDEEYAKDVRNAEIYVELAAEHRRVNG